MPIIENDRPSKKKWILPSLLLCALAGLLLAYLMMGAKTAHDWADKGSNLAKEGKQQEALECFKTAVAYAPTNKMLLSNLSSQYYKLGDYENCSNVCVKSMLVNDPKNPDPDDVIAEYTAHLAYEKSGQFKKAIEDGNLLISKRPNAAKAYAWRAWAYDKNKQYDKAIEDYNKAIGLCTKNEKKSAMYWNCAIVHYHAAQYQKGIDDTNKAIELKQPESFRWSFLGILYARASQYEKALEFYNKAIKADPKNGYYYHCRAVMNGNLGKSELSSADETKAKELGFRAEQMTPD